MTHPMADCFDDSQLNQWLDAEPDERQASLIQHLDACPDCAERLEHLAAEQEFWSFSAATLRSAKDDSCGDSTDELSPVLQSLLGPTEDLHSLGRVGRFEIMGVVGSGGMGTVLKARDVDIERIVALKLPAAHLLDSPAALERIEREARSAATIRHPGIIEIYQIQRWRGIPYLVMPFHTGPSLTSRIESQGRLQLLEAIRIAGQTAEALAAAHRHGVIHRDVKPGNILLGGGTERAVLTDFGIAKIQDDAQVTATGVIVGTPAFLSPEQARGEELTAQSDLFSLGSVLWSMLAGEPPFGNLPTHTVVAKIAAGDMPSVRAFRDDLPHWVVRLIGRLHAADPQRRPHSAERCAALLRACEQHLSDPRRFAVPHELAHQRLAWRRRGTWVAVLTLALVGASVLWTLGDRDRWSPVTERAAETTDRNRQPVAPRPTTDSTPAGSHDFSVAPPTLDGSSPEHARIAEPSDVDVLASSVDTLERELASLIRELKGMQGIEAAASATREPVKPSEP